MLYHYQICNKHHICYVRACVNVRVCVVTPARHETTIIEQTADVMGWY